MLSCVWEGGGGRGAYYAGFTEWVVPPGGYESQLMRYIFNSLLFCNLFQKERVFSEDNGSEKTMTSHIGDI